MSNARENAASTRSAERYADDRGRELSSIDVPDLLGADASPDQRDRLAQVVEWLRRMGMTRHDLFRSRPSSIEWVMLAILAGGVCLITMNGSIGRTLPWTAFGAAALLWYKLKVAAAGLAPRKLVPVAAYTIVCEGFCGKCGYSLRDLPVQDDGCVVCPECGSAWNERRITSGWWLPRPQVELPSIKVKGLQMIAGAMNDVGFDALGRLVPLLTLPHVRGFIARSTLDDLNAWQAIEREVRPIGRAARVCTAFFVLAMFLLGAYALWTQRPAAPAMVVSAAGLLVAMGAWIAVAIVKSDLHIDPPDVARIISGHERCPTCGTKLARRAQDEHMVACSHCGSTWLLPAKNETAM